jgi:hypothetical protein
MSPTLAWNGIEESAVAVPVPTNAAAASAPAARAAARRRFIVVPLPPDGGWWFLPEEKDPRPAENLQLDSRVVSELPALFWQPA